jgi:hypothetical protein
MIKYRIIGNCLAAIGFVGIVFGVMVFCGAGCAGSGNQTTRNFPAINAYIEESMDLLRDMRLTELRMEAAPSDKGGEIVVSGFIHSQKTYDLLIQIFSNRNLSHSPATIVWNVKVDPAVAPNHNMR